jgi:hypothetical protein
MTCDIFVVSGPFGPIKAICMNEIEFVDAVSQTSLNSEKKDYFCPPKSDTRRAGLGLILVGSIALVILLISWAFS